MSDQSYLQKNKGFITSSKLKNFLKCKYRYYLEYEKEEEGFEEDDAKFLQGQAFEDFLYDGQQEWDKKWFIAPPRANRKKTEEATGMKVLSDPEGKAVMIAITEAKRQPILDLNGDYEVRKIITNKYKGKYELRGEIDRFPKDPSANFFRDYKFLRSAENAHRDISEFGWDYLFQMSFYQLLIQLQDDTMRDAKIDIVDKYKFARTICVTIPAIILLEHRRRVFIALEEFIEAQESGEFPMVEQSSRSRECFKCPYYIKCPGAIQKDEVFFDPNSKFLYSYD